jgi:hypothetical protein
MIHSSCQNIGYKSGETSIHSLLSKLEFGARPKRRAVLGDIPQNNISFRSFQVSMCDTKKVRDAMLPSQKIA